MDKVIVELNGIDTGTFALATIASGAYSKVSLNSTKYSIELVILAKAAGSMLLTNEIRKSSTTVGSMVLKTVARASVLKFRSASVKVVMSTLSIKLTKSELGMASRATAKFSI